MIRIRIGFGFRKQSGSRLSGFYCMNLDKQQHCLNVLYSELPTCLLRAATSDKNIFTQALLCLLRHCCGSEPDTDPDPVFQVNPDTDADPRF
jgi:hypothetical protein